MEKPSSSKTRALHRLFVNKSGRPLYFCISKEVQDAAALQLRIESHGGKVTFDEKDVYVKLADPDKSYSEAMFSTAWVEDCIKQGRVLEHDTPAYRLRRTNSKDKVPFTTQDDLELRKYIASLKMNGSKNLKGNRIYHHFASVNKRHPWSSWKDRAKVLRLTEPPSPYETSKAIRAQKLAELQQRTQRSDSHNSHHIGGAPKPILVKTSEVSEVDSELEDMPEMNIYNERHQERRPTPADRPPVSTQGTKNPVQIIDSDDDDAHVAQSQVSLDYEVLRSTSTSMPLEMLGLTEISSDDDDDELHQQEMSQLSLRQSSASQSFSQPHFQPRGHYSTSTYKKEPQAVLHFQPQSKPLSTRSPKKELKFGSHVAPSPKVRSSPTKAEPTYQDQDFTPSAKTTRRRRLPGTIMASPPGAVLAPLPGVIQETAPEVIAEVKPLTSSEELAFAEESALEEHLGLAQAPQSTERSYPSGKSNVNFFSERDNTLDEEVGQQDTAQEDVDWSLDMARSSSPSPWRNSPQDNLPFPETLSPGKHWPARDEDSLLVEESLDTIPPGQGRPNPQIDYHSSSLELSDEDDVAVGRMVSDNMRKQDHNRAFPEEKSHSLPVDLDMHIPEKILSQRATDAGSTLDRSSFGFVGAINSVISSLFSSRRALDEGEGSVERHIQMAGSASTDAPEDEVGLDEIDSRGSERPQPEDELPGEDLYGHEDEELVAGSDRMSSVPALRGDVGSTVAVELEVELEEESRVKVVQKSVVKEEGKEGGVSHVDLEGHGEDEALFLEALGLLNGSVVVAGGTEKDATERLGTTNVDEEQGGLEAVETVELRGSDDSRGDVEDSHIEILEAVEIETAHDEIAKESETNYPTAPTSIPSRTRRARADDSQHARKKVKWSTDPCTEFYMDDLDEAKVVLSNTSDTDDDKQQRTRLLLYLGNKYKEQIRKMTVLELVPKLTAIDILDACSGNLTAARQYMRKGPNESIQHHFWTGADDHRLFSKDNNEMERLREKYSLVDIVGRIEYLMRTRLEAASFEVTNQTTVDTPRKRTGG